MTGTLRIGLIGAGYMGKAHTIGLQLVRTAFQPSLAPVCEMICSTTEEGAAAHATAWGWNRSTADWRALVADPAVDALIIATPPRTHLAMATEALRLGKPVFCEKPLAATPPNRRRWSMRPRQRASPLWSASTTSAPRPASWRSRSSTPARSAR